MIFQPRRREAQRLARTTCLVCFKLKGKHAFVSGEHPSSDLCNCRIECFLCKIDCCNHFVPEGQQQTRWQCKVCMLSPRARDGSQRCQFCVDNGITDTVPIRRVTCQMPSGCARALLY